MRKFSILAFIGFVMFMSSCTEIINTVYSENIKNDEHRMPKNEKYSFEFDNTDPLQLYDVIVMFRYVDGFQFNRVVFDFSHSSPDSDTVEFTMGLPIIDAKGNYIGNGSGDIWDIEHTIISGKALPQGKNVFVLQNKMDAHYEYIPNVMSVGLKVVKLE
ncbi:MAG: hypothetical protein PF481_08040 [Bacteroidales bacterium]|jgi:gliding motility-associated lipoprotein GldH|nr:hypothetical protein [Bacteroidales bacterium]